MQYLSDYKAAEQIMAFTVSIPLVADMGYLIPIVGAKKIPQCEGILNINTTTDTPKKK
jgi:hypothetical protein